MSEERQRVYAEGIRQIRDHTMNTAIAVCEEFANSDGSARQCVAALRDMKAMLPAAPSGQN